MKLCKSKLEIDKVVCKFIKFIYRVFVFTGSRIIIR